jgi:bidirectional [NiFe] hydrogenase diaphorase subunit
MVHLTVDEKRIEAEKGANLLQVCIENGIYIPNLCYLRELPEPHASCRLCFVALEGAPGPVPACTLAAEDGMEVRTDTADVRALQKAALRLLLSVHRVECARCPANRRCELQRIARFLKVGLKSSGLEQRFKEPEVVQEHPSIDHYPNRCVLCARCVRICLSEKGLPMMTLARRGFGTVISFFGRDNREESCDSCRACVKTCPVGALIPRETGP